MTRRLLSYLNDADTAEALAFRYGIPPEPIRTEVRCLWWRQRRQVLRPHRLGPRVTGEVLGHLGAKHGIQTSVEQTVEHFAGLDAAALEVTGGDGFWLAPLYEIQPTKESPNRPANAQSRATQPHDPKG